MLLLLVSLIVMQTVSAQLFESDSVLEIKLEGPVSRVIRAKKQKTPSRFVLEVNGHRQEVLVRARGNSRLRVCRFPPLRLQFNQQHARGSVFSGMDKVKIVTHCKLTSAYQENAIQEYLAYKILNQITDVSYQVRLARITYVDTLAKKNSQSLVRYAFLIEPRLDMIKRLGAQPVAAQGVSLRSLNDAHMAKIYIYQYLIGNTDWSLVSAEKDTVCCHNGTLININQERFYVPYDFDLSGLVNARYAFPDKSLRIRRVTQRLYRGFCQSSNKLQVALDQIRSTQSNIVKIIKDVPGLSDTARLETEKYVNRFFQEAANEQKLMADFQKRCL